MDKAYCECKFKSNEYYGLLGVPPTKRNTTQWVHWPCGRPTKLVWQRWLSRCPECWALFSSPWSILCKSCHAETGVTGATFRGWAWARKVDQEFHRKLLDASSRTCHNEEVGQGPPMPTDRTPDKH